MINVHLGPERLGPIGATWCSARYSDQSALVSKQHPLVAIVGQVGVVFDGERIHVEIVAPRKNPDGARRVTVEQDRIRRNEWRRESYAKHDRADRRGVHA